jgi:hypothetical protein
MKVDPNPLKTPPPLWPRAAPVRGSIDRPQREARDIERARRTQRLKESSP